MIRNGGHGGNIYRAAEMLGISQDRIIDFSASINPLGVPDSVRSAIVDHVTSLIHYPDPDVKALRLKLGEREGIAPERIICGNGSTELIYLIARALRPAKVLVPAPTFAEYERACARMGDATIVHFPLRKEKGFAVDPEAFITALSGCDMAFLCNPNNPTGVLLSREDVLAIAEGARQARCTLVVDEAFIDFCPGASVVNHVEENPYLVVLRSLTKFYALSGLRIGYIVLPEGLVPTVKAMKEPWTVNTLAQAAALAVLDDQAYEDETFRVVAEEKKRLEAAFNRLGLAWFPSAANYYLLSLPSAQRVREALAQKGILVRDCSNFIGLDETFLRVAVRSETENLRLLEEITTCVA